MIRYTREQFEKTFKAPISKLLDLSKFITPEHRIQVMKNPTVAVIKFEYGTQSAPGREDLIVCVEMQWWLGENMHLKGKALAITVFESQQELKQHRREARKKAMVDFNQN